MKKEQYEYYAFISYSHKNMSVAKWLQRKLEGYKLPTGRHNDIKTDSRFLRPVFRDQSDLPVGILSEEIKRQLEKSKYLIVLCSEYSASSSWVNEEVEYFIKLGRLAQIISIIVTDKIPDISSLYPVSLRNFLANKNIDLISVNLTKEGKARTRIRVVSKLLGVSFDSLWKRHLRRKIRNISLKSLVSLMMVCVLYFFAFPVYMGVRVDMENSTLPTGEKVILNFDGGEYAANLGNPHFEQLRLPGYKRFSDIPVTLKSKYFCAVDTVIRPGLGLRKEVYLPIKRDNTFSLFAGHVYDDDLNPLSNAHIRVGNFETVTDGDGAFSINLPLAQQKEEQLIEIELEGYEKILREDETPGDNLKYILHKSM